MFCGWFVGFFKTSLDLFFCNEGVTLNLSVCVYKMCLFESKITVFQTASLYLCELVFKLETMKELMSPNWVHLALHIVSQG